MTRQLLHCGWQLQADIGCTGMQCCHMAAARMGLSPSAALQQCNTAEPSRCRRLAAYVEVKMWSEPGQADSNVALQRYVRCQDGNYHMQDAYGHNHSTFIVPLRVGHRNTQTNESHDAHGQQLCLTAPVRWSRCCFVTHCGSAAAGGAGAGVPPSAAGAAAAAPAASAAAGDSCSVPSLCPGVSAAQPGGLQTNAESLHPAHAVVSCPAQVPEPLSTPATPLAQLAGGVPAGGAVTATPAAEEAALEHAEASAAEHKREQDERELARKVLSTRFSWFVKRVVLQLLQR